MVIHQLVPNFVPGDATGQAALHFRLLLRRLGHTGELFSPEVHPSLARLVHPVDSLRVQPEDFVLYHHGIASSLAGRLMHLPCRKGVIFHNISPKEFYRDTPLYESLVSGRAQLAAMAPFVDMAIGVSNFNARELTEAGYRNIHTVPLFIEPERFSESFMSAAMTKKLEAYRPYVFSVSRLVPHKRFEDILSFFQELRCIRPDIHLVLAGGYAEGDVYFRKLKRQAEAIGHVTFLGRVSNEELVACYRNASLFVSMSEHEGFGVPFLEAFACNVPVLAYAATAVPETLGNHGVAFTEKNFAALAEVARELIENQLLRTQIIKGQHSRLAELSAHGAEQALARALNSVEPPPAAHAPRTKPQRPRVAMVVQRYGQDIIGGAEAHARQVAHKLAPFWDITVLTSCAVDHLTWKNELPVGSSMDGPVRVVRFASQQSRHMRAFNRLSRSVFGKPLDFLSEENWIAAQGPVMPELLRHLSTEQDSYDGFIFFTYLYAPTVWGLPLVANKALLVPTAHDEPPFWMNAYLDVLERPQALLCNTPEEMSLIQRRAPHAARARVVGVGIEPLSPSPDDFRRKFKLEQPYLFYVGRVEEGKGVGELMDFYQAFRRAHAQAPALVLAGKSSMSVSGKNIHYLGPISEQDKYNGMAGALATVVPSKFESLSLVTLESMSVGTPVLGNGLSEVVAGQLERSKAGLTYTSKASFQAALEQLIQNRPSLSKNALQYASGFRWKNVVDIYLDELKRLMEIKA